MFAFLRKHQKWFFIVTTLMVVASFCFFGTYSTIQERSDRKDKKISETVDHSDVNLSMIDRMSYFLGSDVLYSNGKVVNVLNDGVFFKDFIQTGLVDVLVRDYFSLLEKDFTSSLARAKKGSFYTHPYAPELSQRAVFAHFVPELNTYIDTMISSKKSGLESFILMKNIYQTSLRMPPQMVKKVLVYQQNQYRLPPDQRLYYDDLSLFGFQNLQDWFGQSFMDLLSQTILHVAAIAKQDGYSVSYQESFQDLLKNVHVAYQKEKNKEPRSDRDYFQYQLHVLGLDEKTAVTLWQNIMLFRKFFQEKGAFVFMDTFSFKEFSSYAMEKKEMCHYQLPESLRLKSFDDLLAFELYRRAISSKYSMASLDLPAHIVTVDEMEARDLGLVQKFYEWEYKEASLDAVGVAKIRERDLWKWQFEEKNWKELQSHFSALATCGSTDKFHFLEGVDKEIRRKIDLFSREKIVASHPEWVREVLDQSQYKKVSTYLRMDGSNLPLVGVNASKIMSLFDSFSVGLKDVSKDKVAQQLSYYSEDGKNFYSIRVQSVGKNKEIAPYAALLQDGSLAAKVDSYVEQEYKKIRVKDPALYQDKEGKWKPFTEVKWNVAKEVFNPLLKAIEEDYRKVHGSLPSKKDMFSFYRDHRFYHHVRMVRFGLQKNKENLSWVRNASEKDSIENQWKLSKDIIIVARAESPLWIKDAFFSSLPKSPFSSVHVAQNGNLEFVEYKGMKKMEENVASDVMRGKDLLSAEQDRVVLRSLIPQLRKHIVLPIAR
jgi:hypothetical protein